MNDVLQKKVTKINFMVTFYDTVTSYNSSCKLQKWDLQGDSMDREFFIKYGFCTPRS